MVVAKNKVELMRIERKKRLEAERLRKEEEERLKKKMREQEARREAERLHQVRVGEGEGEKGVKGVWELGLKTGPMGGGEGKECHGVGWEREEER